MNQNPNTRCTTSGALTGTGAETVYDTTVTIAFAIDGKAYTKTAVTDGVTPVVDGNTASAFTAVTPDKACLLVWGLNSSGTVSLYQGPLVDVDGTSDARKSAMQFPNIPVDICPFAYTIFQTDGTASAAGLLPGTANWNATGLTATHQNIHVLPSRAVAP